MTAVRRRVGNTCAVFEMGIGLAFRGYAITIGAISRLCIWVNGIAIDRSGRHAIGAGRCTIEFTVTFVGEMVSGSTRSNLARSTLANARFGMVCRVTVNTLRAAMFILIDTRIVIKACISSAGTGDTFPVLTQFIVLALRVTIAAMQRVTFELIGRQAHRFCAGTTIDHAIVACIGTFPLITTARFGGFLVRTDGTAGTAVIGIVAMNVDAQALSIHRTKRFRRIRAR